MDTAVANPTPFTLDRLLAALAARSVTTSPGSMPVIERRAVRNTRWQRTVTWAGFENRRFAAYTASNGRLIVHELLRHPHHGGRIATTARTVTVALEATPTTPTPAPTPTSALLEELRTALKRASTLDQFLYDDEHAFYTRTLHLSDTTATWIAGLQHH